MASRSGLKCLAIVPVPTQPHGAAVVSDAVLRFLADAGISLDIQDTHSSRDGLAYHLSRMKRYCCATRAIRTRKYDFVYICGAGGLSLIYQVMVLIAGRMRSSLFVYHHHSYLYIKKRNVLMGVIGRLSVSTNIVHLVLSDHMKTDFLGCYRVPENRVLVLRNDFVASARVGLVEPKSGRATVAIGHLANLSAVKGLDEVSATWRVLAGEHPALLLEIAGPCTDDASRTVLLALLADYPGRVRYWGPQSDIRDFYGRVDILFFPSRYPNEAAPLVVLEASAAGACVVASDVGCMRDISDVGQVVVGATAAERSTALRHIIDYQVERKPWSGRDHAVVRATARTTLSNIFETASRESTTRG